MQHGCFAHEHWDVADLDHLSRAAQHVPIDLVDSVGHLFSRLAEPMMAEPGESFVLLHEKEDGAVLPKSRLRLKTLPIRSLTRDWIYPLPTAARHGTRLLV
jgi:hypothetical protein